MGCCLKYMQDAVYGPVSKCPAFDDICHGFQDFGMTALGPCVLSCCTHISKILQLLVRITSTEF